MFPLNIRLYTLHASTRGAFLPLFMCSVRGGRLSLAYACHSLLCRTAPRYAPTTLARERYFPEALIRPPRATKQHVADDMPVLPVHPLLLIFVAGCLPALFAVPNMSLLLMMLPAKRRGRISIFSSRQVFRQLSPSACCRVFNEHFDFAADAAIDGAAARSAIYPTQQ